MQQQKNIKDVLVGNTIMVWFKDDARTHHVIEMRDYLVENYSFSDISIFETLDGYAWASWVPAKRTSSKYIQVQLGRNCMWKKSSIDKEFIRNTGVDMVQIL